MRRKPTIEENEWLSIMKASVDKKLYSIIAQPPLTDGV